MNTFQTSDTPNRNRKESEGGGQSGTGFLSRTSTLHSQASSVTEVASDDMDLDLDEPRGLTT